MPIVYVLFQVYFKEKNSFKFCLSLIMIEVQFDVFIIRIAKLDFFDLFILVNLKIYNESKERRQQA